MAEKTPSFQTNLQCNNRFAPFYGSNNHHVTLAESKDKEMNLVSAMNKSTGFKIEKNRDPITRIHSTTANSSSLSFSKSLSFAIPPSLPILSSESKDQKALFDYDCNESKKYSHRQQQFKKKCSNEEKKRGVNNNYTQSHERFNSTAIHNNPKLQDIIQSKIAVFNTFRPSISTSMPSSSLPSFIPRKYAFETMASEKQSSIYNSNGNGATIPTSVATIAKKETESIQKTTPLLPIN